MSAYIKRNSDGRILSSSSGQDQNNPIHTEAMNNFVTNAGWSLDDNEIGFVYDNVYILFDEFVEESSQEEWDELTIFLEEHDIVLDEGSWSELR